MSETIQPSNDSGATRLAIAYDIVRRAHSGNSDSVAVAKLVAECVYCMLLIETGKRDDFERHNAPRKG